ncbi:MAG TPA: cobalamin-binding protein [Pirellulales bacterium]|jgi:iron complex transport system substrate-binding protein|nr:cobalamin-binding protein [Pirellulales bacterium]
MSAPRRIASLLASGTEILYGLGLGECVVAVSHECDWPPDCAGKPRVTFTNVCTTAASSAIDVQVREMLAGGAPLYEIDVEQLVALEPNLIVTQAQCDVCAVKYEDVVSLVQPAAPLAGVPVVALNPFTLGDVLADIERVGSATGCETEAAGYVNQLRRRLDAVRAVTCDMHRDQRPLVACIEWIEPLMIAANWMPEMIELVGARQCWSEAGRHSTYTPWEQLIASDPEVIVVMPCGFDLERTLSEARRLEEFPGWSNLQAVRSGRVYACDGNAYFNRSGPRLVDSVELLVRLVHPQRFGMTGDEPGEANVWRRLTIAAPRAASGR